LFGIADVAIDDEAGPVVLHRELAQIAADQRATHRTAAIDDEHTALARSFQRRTHQRIVLEDLEGLDRAMESQTATEVAEDRLADLGFGMGVGKIGRRGAHGSVSSFEKDKSCGL